MKLNMIERATPTIEVLNAVLIPARRLLMLSCIVCVEVVSNPESPAENPIKVPKIPRPV